MTTGPARPVIGLTTYRQTTSWWGWERDAALVPGTYLDVLEAAGGQPVLLPPSSTAGTLSPAGAGAEELLGRLDGLVLTGGGDLEPASYRRAPDPRTVGTNQARDELELGLVRGALAVGLPVLAVCRGLQVLNVALGGDLVQHLPEPAGSAHRPRPGAFGPVSIRTEPASTVRQLFGPIAEVQCSHHQAIGTPAPGLRITARSSDGLIEAVELPGQQFVVGVQWHPEETGDTRLFEALVAAAASETHPPAVAARLRP